jgi:hypothetical protein
MASTSLRLGLLSTALLAAACGSDPTTPPALLTRHDPEPAGAHCKDGGTALEVGLDVNGNGALDDAEIQRTDYACDAPPSQLVRQEELTPGSHCPGAGTAVYVGADDNGDGKLEDSEIDQTSYVCAATELWDGDFKAADWANPDSVAMLAKVKVITGSLAITTDQDAQLPLLEVVNGNVDATSATGLSIDAPHLRQIGGDLTIYTASALDAKLPALERVVGNLLFEHGGGEGLSVPALREIGGAFGYGGSGPAHLPALATIGHGITINSGSTLGLDVPVLTSVGGDLEIETATYSTLAFPALISVAGSIDTNTSGLAGLELPVLRHVGGGFSVLNVPLTTIALPALEDVGGSFSLFGLTLATLDLGKLAHLGGGLGIQHMRGLSSYDLPSLIDAAGLNVSDDNLPYLEIKLPALTTMLTIAAAGPELFSIDAPGLTRLDALGTNSVVGLEHLTEVTGDLSVSGASGPTLGLTALVHVGGNLAIDHDVNLTDIGLPALRSVDGRLEISDDAALSSLQGLAALRVVVGTVTVNGTKVAPADIAELVKRVGK